VTKLGKILLAAGAANLAIFAASAAAAQDGSGRWDNTSISGRMYFDVSNIETRSMV
jgi:hypothetical protein